MLPIRRSERDARPAPQPRWGANPWSMRHPVPTRRLLALALVLVAASAACAPPIAETSQTRDAAPGDAATRAAARTTLRDHVRWILDRPAPAKRLFVEGYFARTLVAAYDVFAASPGDSALARTALAGGFAFAESLVGAQRDTGYWRLGYDTGWVADMGAALGIFPVLEPHADSLQLARYVRTAERFVAALERDRLILPAGAVGVGWPLGDHPERVQRAWRSDVGWSDDPYLVATALAGVEVHAWLYRRTSDARYRERALRALDWTVAQLRADGSLPDFARGEGELTAAAYAEEGWMAADAYLAADSLHVRLCRELDAHVRWLLRIQAADGTWGGGVGGERARAPAIVGFLVWCQSRCGDRPELREAAGRAAKALVRFEATWAPGQEAENTEVLRAMVGRPLAALAAGRPVP